MSVIELLLIETLFKEIIKIYKSKIGENKGGAFNSIGKKI